MKTSFARTTLGNEPDKYWETIGTLRSDDATAARSKNKKTTNNRFNKQNNTFALASHLFEHFSAIFVRLTRENAYVNGGRKKETTKFYLSFCTWTWFLGIQLLEGSPTFDEVSGKE